ncbi:replication initiation protein [Vibrio rotiferianus CAIM 577 = LMG 21460]|nr:replication initiation protein [Vibrio rotiferianus CAIM 577 = LMG 21460]
MVQKIDYLLSSGYFRTVEVTYNERKDNFHPHIHALILVNKADYQKYFKLQDRTIFKTQSLISNAWRNLLKVDYNPMYTLKGCIILN